MFVIRSCTAILTNDIKIYTTGQIGLDWIKQCFMAQPTQ